MNIHRQLHACLADAGAEPVFLLVLELHVLRESIFSQLVGVCLEGKLGVADGRNLLQRRAAVRLVVVYCLL